MGKYFFVCLLTLWGCATPYTEEGLLGGYRDYPMGKERFHITVQGNGYVNTGTIEEYFYRRASEIVQDQGYSRYEVISLKTSMEPWGLMCCF